MKRKPMEIQPHPGWQRPYTQEDRRVFWKKYRQHMKQQIRKAREEQQ